MPETAEGSKYIPESQKLANAVAEENRAASKTSQDLVLPPFKTGRPRETGEPTPKRSWWELVHFSRQAMGLITACICGTGAVIVALLVSKSEAMAILASFFTFLTAALTNYLHLKGAQRDAQIGKQAQQ